MKKEVCMFCGAPATLLCDGHLGYPPKVENGLEFIDPLHPYTCDAPICSGCAAPHGKMHICRRRHGCITETIDYCPICITVLPPYPQHNRRLIFSPAQAKTVRSAHWTSFSNEYQKRLRVEHGGGQQCLDL
ncbi:hypothetical protein [Serratia sp. JSRIV004]|uniref:hypothetical protein n=1 Tax=Serratia sp. JSRIV004 TaxID=2831895 RepID=UPI001CBCC641|nr:hypothetical protein [Serratia sp. JSRIV004]UAN55365.1 hypothetical protein KGP21_16830 [Serratia sp. JSRIV004]